MSSNDPTAPIPPARFAAALRDLPVSSLALKAAEIRNSIAHLEYSNLQLQPFAHPAPGEGTSDPDCVEAIQENEVVIARMNERISLLKVEVERRGISWREFEGPEERAEREGDKTEVNGAPAGDDDDEMMLESGNANGASGHIVNGVEERHAAWTDGTFTVGTIGGPSAAPEGAGAASRSSGQQGGRLGDEELRRRMEETMRAALGDDDDEGMHL